MKSSISRRTSAITVDVEDAVNQAMRNFFGTEMEPTKRVYENTIRLLDLFSEYNTRATFFILGEVAQTFPELVKKISRDGHELGIHGYSHTPYNRLTNSEIRTEICKTKNLVEDISGNEVLGHRAPEFSINRSNFSSIMKILMGAGIKYDSSIVPVRTKRYGWPGFTKDIDWVTVENSKIIEAPLPTYGFCGKEIPVCGGGYLRSFPYYFTKHSFNHVLKERPVITYLHPYEIDCPPFQEFYMDALGKSTLKEKIKLHSYWFNRKTVIPKVRRLLGTFNFDSLSRVIENSLDVKF